MIRFIVYADLHHDQYNNGITLADTISIEDEITRYAQDHHINIVIFAGDWHRATNPLQSVIKSAEASWKRRSDLGITTYAIPGNHDRWTKSINSGHAFSAADVFKSDLKNVRVFDSVTIYEIDGTNFLFIPAWHERNLPAKNLLRMCPSGDLVVVFHGMLTGSKLPGNRDANGSIDIEILKNLEATLLLGGDNHTPQYISDIPNCYYIGAPLQHNWGDRDQNRGFWDIKIDNHKPTVLMIPTRAPRFIRFSVLATNEVETVCRIGDELANRCANNQGIVEVTLVGESAQSIDREFIESSTLGMGVRRVTVIIDRSFDKLEISPLVAQATTIEDKWNAYVSSGVAPGMDGLDPVLLSNIGLNAILTAKSNV